MAARRVLAAVCAIALVVLGSQSQAFVSGTAQLQRRASSRVAAAATAPGGSSGSSFSLPVFDEDEENSRSASVVVFFVLGLLFPLVGGFTFGLILAAVGYGLTNGGIKSFAEKNEATKEYAGYVTKVGDVGEKAGGYALKAYNFVAVKSKELTA
mmetsp:Transcript_16394/g.29114  ORF Transcript_16394/g.29114 Transcript_16394/m.29114 type:complete len:154 (-) Transcript_16394:128-589(-)